MSGHVSSDGAQLTYLVHLLLVRCIQRSRRSCWRRNIVVHLVYSFSTTIGIDEIVVVKEESFSRIECGRSGSRLGTVGVQRHENMGSISSDKREGAGAWPQRRNS